MLNEVYEVGEAKEFKRFDEWKANGYTVKKGEKAFVIWGQRVEDEKSYFPIRFLFSDLQVLELRDCRETEAEIETQEQPKQQQEQSTQAPTTTTDLEDSLI